MKNENEKPYDEWTQQDLAFKLADELETTFDIKYPSQSTQAGVYEINSVIISAIEKAGLKLVIDDSLKFHNNNGVFF